MLPGSDSYTSLHYSRCLRSPLSAEPFLPASVTRASWSCCLEHPSSTDACFHQKCLISKLKKLFMCVYTYLGVIACEGEELGEVSSMWSPRIELKLAGLVGRKCYLASSPLLSLIIIHVCGHVCHGGYVRPKDTRIEFRSLGSSSKPLSTEPSCQPSLGDFFLSLGSVDNPYR